ncbi:MAG: four helix bundle protein [Bacteroidia bacterium]|nr:four helix bundle protein [Bacteroidia bacterium]
MSKINSYKDLIVWQRAIDIAVEVYKITKKFPSDEIFGLTSQVRRASYSVSLNIAEGHGRNTTKSFLNFLRIAKGSLDELESGFILATRLEFVKEEELKKLNDSITQEMKMLVSLIKVLELKVKKKTKKIAKIITTIIAIAALPIAYSLFTNPQLF